MMRGAMSKVGAALRRRTSLMAAADVTEIWISLDGGGSWVQGDFLDPINRHAWRRWKYDWITPAQPVEATQALNLSAGVSNCKVSRGRSFSWRATLFR